MQDLKRIGEALDLIVCPVCYGRLALIETFPQGQNPLIACSACQRRYPVEDGIPILLASRAST